MTRTRSEFIQVTVAPGNTGQGTYQVIVPMTWITEHAGDTGALDPCVFVAPASDGSCVCVLAYLASRTASIQFIEMSLGDMARFGIKPVPLYLMSDVFPKFRAVMGKLTKLDRGVWGSGKSRSGRSN